MSSEEGQLHLIMNKFILLIFVENFHLAPRTVNHKEEIDDYLF